MVDGSGTGEAVSAGHTDTEPATRFVATVCQCEDLCATGFYGFAKQAVEVPKFLFIIVVLQRRRAQANAGYEWAEVDELISATVLIVFLEESRQKIEGVRHRLLDDGEVLNTIDKDHVNILSRRGQGKRSVRV